jgi:hypothetical protein
MSKPIFLIPVTKKNDKHGKGWIMQGLMFGEFRDAEELSEFIHKNPLPVSVSSKMFNTATGHVINVEDLIKSGVEEKDGLAGKKPRGRHKRRVPSKKDPS